MSPRTSVLKRSGAKKVRDKNFVASTEKIFAVLEAFSQHPHSAMSLEEITQSARLAKTTLHRLLYSMQKIGYVDQHVENGKYMLSQKFFELGRDALPYQRLTSLAKPFINALMLRFGESIHIGVLEDGLVTNIAVCESQHPYHLCGIPHLQPRRKSSCSFEHFRTCRQNGTGHGNHQKRDQASGSSSFHSAGTSSRKDRGRHGSHCQRVEHLILLLVGSLDSRSEVRSRRPPVLGRVLRENRSLLDQSRQLLPPFKLCEPSAIGGVAIPESRSSPM
jgi:hypothetical protein